MAKVTLELGGKYTAGEAFQKASDDVKKFGRENKDAIKAGTDTLKELEKGFGEDLGGAVGKAQGVISGLVSGGLWGALAAVVGMAIGAVVDWFKQAEENAKELAKACGETLTNNLKKLGEQFKDATGDIANAKTEIKDFAAIAQGEIVNAANAKIHQLHVETLQKITDTMSDAARKVLTADEALRAAKIRQEAAIQLAAAKEEEQKNIIANANEKVQKAQEQKAGILVEQNNLSIHEREVIKRYAELKAEEEDITRRYKDNMLTANHAAELHAAVLEDLNELMEKNKGVIDANSAAAEAATAAEKTIKEAIHAREHEERQLTLVQQQNTESLRSAEKTVIDAT